MSSAIRSTPYPPSLSNCFHCLDRVSDLWNRIKTIVNQIFNSFYSCFFKKNLRAQLPTIQPAVSDAIEPSPERQEVAPLRFVSPPVGLRAPLYTEEDVNLLKSNIILLGTTLLESRISPISNWFFSSLANNLFASFRMGQRMNGWALIPKESSVLKIAACPLLALLPWAVVGKVREVSSLLGLMKNAIDKTSFYVSFADKTYREIAKGVSIHSINLIAQFILCRKGFMTEEPNLSRN